MPKRDREYSYLTKRVAEVEAIKPGAVTPKQMAYYFLSNGVDFKGQTQTGYTAKGGGFGIDVQFDPGKLVGLTAEFTFSGSVDKLQQSIIFVTRGPSKLGNVPISKPIILSSLMGNKWKGALGVEFKVGLGAEVGAGVNSGGGFAEAKHDLEEEEEEDEPALDLEGIETIGVKASFFVGLTLSAMGNVEHYFGIDPGPMYYDDNERKQLVDDLGNWLSNETRKHLLKKEASELLNLMRRFIASRSKGNENLRRAYRDSLGLERLGFGKTGDFDAHDAGEHLVKNLSGLIAGLQRGPYTSELLDGGKYKEDLARIYNQAIDLQNKLQPLYQRASQAGCWLKMWSVSGSLGGKLGAEAEAEATVSCIASAKLAGSVNLVEGTWAKRRTNLVWQTEHGLDENGSGLHCTQDTVIHYTSADAKALAFAVEAEARLAHLEYKKDLVDWNLAGAGYNSMTYQSGILYWKQPQTATASVKPLRGSGVAFGQSVIIKNLLSVCEKLKGSQTSGASSPIKSPTSSNVKIAGGNQPSPIFGPLKGPIVLGDGMMSSAKKKPVETWDLGDWKNTAPKRPADSTSKWVKSVAKSLRVTVDELTKFLTHSFVVDVLTDLERSTQDLNNRQSDPWGDRGVLLESSFSFEGNVPSLVYENNKLKDGVRNSLQAIPSRKLQAIRLRFRISDCFASEKTFRLGFKLFGTGIKVAFKKLAEAGTEGIITLCCMYFPASLDQPGALNEEEVVPPVTLFSQ